MVGRVILGLVFLAVAALLALACLSVIESPGLAILTGFGSLACLEAAYLVWVKPERLRKRLLRVKQVDFAMFKRPAFGLGVWTYALAMVVTITSALAFGQEYGMLAALPGAFVGAVGMGLHIWWVLEVLRSSGRESDPDHS